MPLATDKVEGPSRCVTFLGIERHTCEEILHFPEEKLVWVEETLARWSLWRSCCRCHLSCLLGFYSVPSELKTRQGLPKAYD